MRFAERLKLLRKELHLKQDDFARACGVKLTAISKYENELIKPGFDMLMKISLAYNVNLNWLVNEIGTMFVETPQRRLVKTGSDDFAVEITDTQTSTMVFENKHSFNLENDLKVEYYGGDNDNFTKIYHKNGDIEYHNKKDITDNIETLIAKINEISEDKNKMDFVLTAIKAIDNENALNELKILIKGMEIYKK